MAETQIAQPRKAPASIEQMLNSDKTKAGFAAVATEYLTPEKMLRMCVSAIRRTPKLGKCDPSSVLGAMMTAQSLGLEPNTVLGHAYLIPYNRRALVNGKWGDVPECQFQLGYKGLIALMRRNPHVIDVFGECVHQGDIFEYEQGSNTMVRFKKALTERGEPIAAFAYMKFKRGDFDAEAVYVLPLEEIEKIRDQSDTWKFLRDKANASGAKPNDKKKFADTPWEKWFGEMAAKSAIKRLAKQQDLAPAVQVAASLDDAGDTGRAEIAKMADPQFAKDVIEGVAVPVSDDEPAQDPPDIQQPNTAKKPAKSEQPAPQPAAAEARPADPPHDSETGEILDQSELDEIDDAQEAGDTGPADPDDDNLFQDA